ncbi:uncharacterized protein LOC110815562 [Carica papaya]|uniref:uncharacterized protein LOC110815562 n=1 Tax=Carica papaya TaxID=3649 RepID=UPI000B8CA7CC|nr:uncharacterized protein LOC110815562 [Carica papaya]
MFSVAIHDTKTSVVPFLCSCTEDMPLPSESDKWGWDHVSVFGGFDRGSGTKRWKCNHCNLRYNGSYSRVRAHLLGFSGVGVKSCPAIDRSLREAFQILEEERLARKKKKNSGNGKPSKHIRASLASHSWKTTTKEDVDDNVARFFYADGLNINIVNSPYFHEMVKTIAVFGSGYEPPSVEKLSGSLLNKEKGRIEKASSLIRESWPHTGCTILCVNRVDATLGLFHISVFVSSPRGLIFLKALDVHDDVDADDVFACALSDAIIEVGPKYVLQVISCLGHACKSSESIISLKFPYIFWSPCTSNSVRTLMEEMAELEWIKPSVLCAKAIEQCMLTYQHSFPGQFSQNLKDFPDQQATKFAPSYCLIKKIFELKQVLQVVVGGEEWKQWKHSVLQDHVVVESAILGDDFWGKADLLLQLYEPFVALLSTIDVDKSVMGAIYDWRVQALEALRDRIDSTALLSQVEVLMEDRWDMLFSPLHAAGYILNPRYFGRGQLKDKNVMRGWKATLEKYECDGGSRRILREQLSSYWRLEGSFGEEDAVDCRDKMDPVAWWENFGFETSDLQTLAIKVLSQVASVSCCEEIWECSSDFPCQEAANKLGVERVEDIVFVRNNLRLHSQRSTSYVFGLRNTYSSSPSGIKDTGYLQLQAST